MPRKKWNYDIEQVELTHLTSGDMNNNIFYSYFSSNTDQKKKVLDTLLTKNGMRDVTDMIFSGSISDDQFRKIATALTFYDAVLTITNNSADCTANDLYFAAIVNWNVSKGNGTNMIRSYSAVSAARDSDANDGGTLDYKTFLVNGEGEGKFNGDYTTILISPKGYGNKMELHLPILPIRPIKLGLFRFCTEHVAGYMTIVGDPDSTSHMLPAHIWMAMLEQGISKRITTKFSKLETKHLSKLVDTDHKYIDDILAINDFQSAFSFMNAYQLDFTDDGQLSLVNTTEPPIEEVEKVSGFEFKETRANTWWLKSADFYIVSSHGSSVYILTQ